MADKIDLDHLTVNVKDRTGQVFSGSVMAITSINNVGPFDVLPRHSNMVTTIKEKLDITHTNNTKKSFKISTGLLRVTSNSVEIYLGLWAI